MDGRTEREEERGGRFKTEASGSVGGNGAVARYGGGSQEGGGGGVWLFLGAAWR